MSCCGTSAKGESSMLLDMKGYWGTDTVLKPEMILNGELVQATEYLKLFKWVVYIYIYTYYMLYIYTHNILMIYLYITPVNRGNITLLEAQL